MEQDHYAVLGVSPAAEPVVIRAAYRALMRRYHPDADTGAEAAERARAINLAYAVLGNPGKRARYDEILASKRPLRFEPAPPEGLTGRRGSRVAPAAAISFTLLAAAMVAFAVLPPGGPLSGPRFSVGGTSKPVKVDAASPEPASNPSEIAPPPVRSRSAPKTVLPVEAIASDLLDSSEAPVARKRPSARAIEPPTPASVASDAGVPSAATPQTGTKSNCLSAAGRADRMICGNANLSSLDRQLVLLYRQSWSEADEAKRAALLGTRQRFNDRRDACASASCLTTAYVSRLKEISDIMAGRVQP